MSLENDPSALAITILIQAVSTSLVRGNKPKVMDPELCETSSSIRWFTSFRELGVEIIKFKIEN